MSWSDPDHDIMADLRDARERARATYCRVIEDSHVDMAAIELAAMTPIPLPPNSIEASNRDDGA